jgi:hypothetical protein
VRDPLLDVARDRASELGEDVGWSGERDDREAGSFLCVALDDERFLTAFGMSRECAVREPETVGFVDCVDDATRRERVERGRACDDDHIGARLQRRGRRVDGDARAEVCLPLSESRDCAIERADSQVDGVTVVRVTVRWLFVSGRTDLRVGDVGMGQPVEVRSKLLVVGSSQPKHKVLLSGAVRCGAVSLKFPKKLKFFFVFLGFRGVAVSPPLYCSMHGHLVFGTNGERFGGRCA